MMRVMPRLLKLVSSVLSGRNHSGRIVGNPSFTGLWKGCPFIRPESGLMSTRTSTHTESPSIPKYEHFRPRLLKLSEQPFAVVHGTMRVQVRLLAADAMP